jgi:DNA-binding response OmpR family regulator
MKLESEFSVLLIADEPDAAELIQHFLSRGSGTRGREHLVQREYQAIRLDLNLPDSSGFEPSVRIWEAVPDLPVIVLTGQEGEDLALQTVRAGAGEYPFHVIVRTGLQAGLLE